MTKLILAEKPMLARAIADALPGSAVQKSGYTVKGEYTIVSAFGHLLTLKEPEDYDPEKYRKWSLDTLPIYFPDWEKKPGEGKAERLALIGELLKEASCVIHAGDPDDEGQYLIDEILQWFHYSGPVYRLATGDTTEAALRKAMASLKDNRDFVNAGWSAHARSVADIMVGFNCSRFFSLQNPHVRMLTVGRVQTPALGLVVTRDLAIENHSKQSYFTIRADLEVDGHTVPARYEPAKDDPNLEDGRITDKEYAEDLVRSLSGQELRSIRVTVKEYSEQPPLPFNLVKLQTYCSGKFGYEPSETLAITQSLRDNHNAITYNRSDCQYLSEDQYRESPATIRQVLSNLEGTPAEAVFSRITPDPSLHSSAFNDKNITAHTAIIPQNKRMDLLRLSEKERNVYLAIVKYYLAQFLPPASKSRTSLEVPAEGGTLRAVSTKILSPGYLRLIRPEHAKNAEEEEENENELSQIAPGTYDGRCLSARAEEKETKAPPRYTKASLNEDMTRIAKYVTDPHAKALLLAKDKEKKGENGSIGTSATRASIIDNLEARGFIESRGRQIRSTQLGRELYRILPDELKKPDMTGLWWAVQESIQEGSQPWTALTDSVLDMIRKILVTSYPKVDAYHVPESMRRGSLLLGTCPRCGKDIMEGKLGFGCTGYKDGCRFTIWKTAKSGMMSRTELTADMVHDLLSEGWIEDIRTDDSGLPVKIGRTRTKKTMVFKKLYSETKKCTYPGRVCLVDEGPASQRGAYFTVDEIVNEPPQSLGKCPRCGRDVIEGKQGFGCTGYKDGCRFVIWKKAKSGMMSRTRITKGIVQKFLKSTWLDDPDPDSEFSVRKRTEISVHVRTLYSESKNKTYSGDVYLTDEGPNCVYGASFRLASVTNDGPEILGKCPRCGCDVVESGRGFGCTGYRDGCRFSIWKNSKMKLLANVSFTKTDARKFLAGKPVHKKKLLDKKEQEFAADLLMIEEADNPFGPVYRVVAGTIEPKSVPAEEIRTETVAFPPPEAASAASASST